MSEDNKQVDNDPKTNKKSAPGFNTTHDLRKHAEEALRLLREAQQKADEQVARNEAAAQVSGAAETSHPSADTDDDWQSTLMGNTTHDLAREAAEAMRLMQEEDEKRKAAAQASQAQTETPSDEPQANADPEFLADVPEEDPAEPEAPMVALRDDLGQPMVLRLDISDAYEPLVVDVHDEMIIGRGDNVTNYTPDIDLTKHGGYRLGLSRRHARLERIDGVLHIIDMGSRNGTHLNGMQLAPETPQPLQNGDEIQLGNLVFRLVFQQNS